MRRRVGRRCPRTLRRSAATAACRCASVGARTSSENVVRPGITFMAPGCASMRPTVATTSGSPVAMRSTASTHCAAAASASRRKAIGTVPAWPAMPVNSMLKRLPPLMAVTTPTGKPSLSSTGPCSMCNSAYACNCEGLRATAAMPSGSSPKASSASRIVMPWRPPCRAARYRTCRRWRDCRATSTRNARPPRRRSPPLRWRTAADNRSHGSAATHSIAAITPSMPSYLPASRTVSRCEPSIRHGSPAVLPS